MSGDATIVKKPWGYEQHLEEMPKRFKDRNEPSRTKILVVHPGHSLSLQLHKDRDEYWTVLSGMAGITLGSECYVAYVGTQWHIPRGMIHQLRARTDHVVVLEESVGDVWDDDDIVRLADDYGRLSDIGEMKEKSKDLQK